MNLARNKIEKCKESEMLDLRNRKQQKKQVNLRSSYEKKFKNTVFKNIKNKTRQRISKNIEEIKIIKETTLLNFMP